MKKSKVISLVLLLFLICALILSPSVAAQGGDPQDAIIKQVMEDTALHLGYSVSWDGTLVESPRTHYKYGVSSPDHRSNLIYLGAYSTESDAEFAWSQSKVTSEPVYTETFHGYDAFYIQSTLTRYHFYVQIGRFVLETHCVGCSGPDKLSADVLYNNGLQHGLFSPGGTTPTPDSDGDGVPDDVDACPGTPAGVAVDDKGCHIGMQLSVSTDKKAYSPGETVIIRGSVWDAKGGLDGATVVVDVDGTKLTATAYSTEKYKGKYECKFPLPAGISQGEYTVTATASYSGYSSVSESTTFSVGEMGITVKTADVIPIPGEMPLAIKAVLDKGKPMKGRIVDVQVVDENDKMISWVSVEQDPSRGSILDDNGEIEPILKVREPEGLERPTYLRDWPLKATIKIKISDKGAKKALIEKNIVLPFNLALIHGVVVDNKDLKPITQHFVPEVLGISELMVFEKEKNQEGDFWVMVKPYHPQSKMSIQELMAKKNDFRLEWDVYENLPLVYSIDEAPEAGERLELGKVGKTPLEKIKAWYNEFGRTPHTWPDGTIEATPLVGDHMIMAM